MSFESLTPVHQETTPTLIARQLRWAIERGELKPGQQLNEAELSKGFGVSRGPFREAMQRLTQEGLLTAIRNRGVFVRQITPQDVEDLYLARMAIEGTAVERVIERGSASAFAELEQVVEQMGRARNEENAARLTALDIHFHQRLVDLAASERLSHMHETLLVETRMCIVALEKAPWDPDLRVTEHRAIARAICDRDTPTARCLLAEHMDDAVERLFADQGAEMASTTPSEVQES